MHNFLETIRALKTSFKVLENTTEEIVLAVKNAEFGGGLGPITLSFVRPYSIWASEWDVIRGEWRHVPEFSLPEHGEINEAYIKSAGNHFMLSFSEMSTPLVRWGFTAEDVQIDRCISEE